MDGCVPPPSLIHQYPPLPLKHHLRIYRINTFMSHPVSVYLCICVSEQAVLSIILTLSRTGLYRAAMGCIAYRAVWGCMGCIGLAVQGVQPILQGCIGLAVWGVSPMTPVSTLLLMKQPCGVGDIRHISHHHHHQDASLTFYFSVFKNVI